MSNKILVFGGSGALGSKCIATFKQHKWWVACVDYKRNFMADINVILKKKSDDNEEVIIQEALTASLQSEKLDAIISVAGAWKGGNAKENLILNSQLMWKNSVFPSLLAASIATKHLQQNGLLVLSGAASAINETPTMIGYGLAKNSVHYLCKSLANVKSGMPHDSTTVAILPTILDTAENRKNIPKGNFANWTSLDYVANTLFNWCCKKELPPSGSLLKFISNEIKTVP